MPDDVVPPVAAIGAEPVAPPAPSSPRAARPAAAVAGPPAPAHGEGVGDAATHQQIEHPVHAPGSVAARATVHDAAEHGNRIAQAIEAADRRPGPLDRSLHLAGAAAVAGSGQASPVDLTRSTTAHEDIPPVDPLAAVGRVGDDQSGDDQRRHDDHARGEARIDDDQS